jgi:hypothetical protein
MTWETGLQIFLALELAFWIVFLAHDVRQWPTAFKLVFDLTFLAQLGLI